MCLHFRNGERFCPQVRLRLKRDLPLAFRRTAEVIYFADLRFDRWRGVESDRAHNFSAESDCCSRRGSWGRTEEKESAFLHGYCGKTNTMKTTCGAHEGGLRQVEKDLQAAVTSLRGGNS